jgi:hypothetical protein
MSTFETVFWERNSHQSNRTVILFCFVVFSQSTYVVCQDFEDEIYISYWETRSIIPRPVKPEPGWLSLIRGSTEPGQSYLGRSYLSRVGYHSFGRASSPAGHTWPRAGSTSFEGASSPAGHTWPRPARPHWREHRLDPIRGSIRPGRSYLTSVGSISFEEALRSTDHIWSRSTRSHSREHIILLYTLRHCYAHSVHQFWFVRKCRK